MYQVFNMGIGMAIVVAPRDAEAVQTATRAKRIGKIEPGSGATRLIL